ncbi:glucose 1-dehydrogenase [Nocardia grenadensis]|uniref:glucose 1-dehydrogenase n=1 Tax=Nocardia grenadensis TaxID=931537 RepID=UPI0007A39F28|nr:glucose 1-dehydrogenase [Nocardia grenadensis]
MGRFDNHTVLITGATSGQGARHAHAFHSEGAQVVLTGREDEAGRASAAELGHRAHFVHLDVSREEDWTAAVEQVQRHFGPITILVNNAGIQNRAAEIEHTDLGDWRTVLDVNLTGAFLGIRAVTPSMRAAGGGSIVNIASTMAHVGTAFYAPYTASKWALRGLTRTAALELGRDNIRVNSIAPGVVSTPLINEPAAPGERPISDFYTPDPFAVPRLADPEEISRLLLFITSPEASFATGSEFVLDGGLLLGPALKYDSGTAA